MDSPGVLEQGDFGRRQGELLFLKAAWDRLDTDAKRRVFQDVAEETFGLGEIGLLRALDLGLPVVIIDRPLLPPGEHVSTVDGVMDWLRAQAARV